MKEILETLNKIRDLAPKIEGYIPATDGELLIFYYEKLEESKLLLKDAVFMLNQFPNKKFKGCNKDSYTVASEVSKFLDDNK